MQPFGNTVSLMKMIQCRFLHESVMTGRTGWHPSFRQRTWLSGFLIPVVLTVFSLLLSGCGTSENESANEAALRDQSAVNPTFEGVKLRVAAMQDPALGQVTGDMVGEWQASRKAEVEIATQQKPMWPVNLILPLMSG